MGGLFIILRSAALLFGGAHGEGAAIHGYHFKVHTFHGEGLVSKSRWIQNVIDQNGNVG